MTPPDDFPDEMDKFPFPSDERDADAVFGVASGTQPVPEDLSDVADLVHAARGAAAADELAGEDVIVPQLAALIREHAASPRGDAHERIRVLSKFRTAKVAVASTAVLVLGATAAAAATCTLPAPVQNSVARSLSDVGINLPTHHKVELAVKHTAPGPKVKALHHRHPTPVPGAFGTVASVNGVSDPGACGAADTAGSFSLTGPKGKAFTVNVSATTPVVAKGVTGATFANVCVGDLVAAKGTVAGGIVTATKIFVTPPHPPHVPSGASGIVASVNGVSDPGTCGVSGAAGLFTLTTHKGKTFTVNVSMSTLYADKALPTATFANVCVGDLVRAKGAVVDPTVTATNVVIVPMPAPHMAKHHHHLVFGAVAAVNGVTTIGTCGSSGASGAFTLNARKSKTFTVSVDPSTRFRMFGVMTASFANVCVGAKVGAEGDVTGTAVTATGVFVFPAATGHHDADHVHKGFGHFPKPAASSGNQHADDDHAAPSHQIRGGSGATGGSGGSGAQGKSHHKAHHSH